METFQWTCQDIIEGASIHTEKFLKPFTITQLHHQIVASPLFPSLKEDVAGPHISAASFLSPPRCYQGYCNSISSALLPGLLQLQHRLLLRLQVLSVNKEV